jgi:ElaA protein
LQAGILFGAKSDIKNGEIMKLTFIAKSFTELNNAELYEIVRARQEVFLMEQNIVCRDFDGIDYDALHCFLWDGARVLAYLRAFEEDNGQVKIGRVLSLTHGVGHGRLLMEEAMPKIQENFGCDKIFLHSQKHAEGFYEKLGFTRLGEEFLEEGIPHVEMVKEI